MRFKHYSIRTEETYREWIKRFILFHGKRHPRAEHLKRVKLLHEKDLAEGNDSVYLPYALKEKYPNADREWAWQYVFRGTVGRLYNPKAPPPRHGPFLRLICGDGRPPGVNVTRSARLSSAL